MGEDSCSSRATMEGSKFLLLVAAHLYHRITGKGREVHQTLNYASKSIRVSSSKVKTYARARGGGKLDGGRPGVEQQVLTGF